MQEDDYVLNGVTMKETDEFEPECSNRPSGKGHLEVDAKNWNTSKE
ncbi:hypothetical protein GsuE55_31950 [Geobacillus subterraneus]|uniref:Uncharacterized protein n=1 Tax=Geobacillus subterraneus TaxID=129338 RepID=A0A679FP28_9BACL|nr:hypothetical protein B4113_1097 [Geobacillus sp. B4113_201601]BBW98362.1 hypothetical protein GsuE55_31950 [Geobacillus subterraneus]